MFLKILENSDWISNFISDKAVTGSDLSVLWLVSPECQETKRRDFETLIFLVVVRHCMYWHSVMMTFKLGSRESKTKLQMHSKMLRRKESKLCCHNLRLFVAFEDVVLLLHLDEIRSFWFQLMWQLTQNKFKMQSAFANLRYQNCIAIFREAKQRISNLRLNRNQSGEQS